MEGFSVTTTQVTDDHVVFAVTGELDLATADELWAALESWLAADRIVVIDCGRLAFMDSTGLRTLLRATKRAEEAGTHLRIAGMQPDVSRVLDLAGVSGKIPVRSDVEDALAG